MEYLRNRGRHALPACILILAAAAIVVDVLDLNSVAIVGGIASVLFLGQVGLIGLYGGILMFRLILMAVRKPAVWAVVVALLMTAVLVGSAVPLGSSVSGETTQEVACGMRAISERWDGWQHACFLGYPLRQYVAMAVPTYIFGRSVTALHIGTAVIFLTGLGIFVSGIVSITGIGMWSAILGVGMTGLLLHATFVTHFLFQFEQSIIPISLSLALVGSYLWYLGTKNTVHLAMSVVILGMCAVTYTSSLVLFPLSFAVSLDLYERMKRNVRPYLFIGLVVSASALFISFVYRQDIKFGTGTLPSSPGSDLLAALRYLTVADNYYSYGTMLFKIGFWVALLLMFVSGTRRAFIGIWVLGVVAVSILSKGYAWYGVDFRMHRSIVVLPVLLLSYVFLPGMRWPRWVRIALMAGSVAVFLSGVAATGSRLMQRPSKIRVTVAEAIRTLPDARTVGTGSRIVTIIDAKDKPLGSIHDEMQYFIPDMKVRHETDSLQPPLCHQFASDIIVIHLLHPCTVSVARLMGKDTPILKISEGSDSYLIGTVTGSE